MRKITIRLPEHILYKVEGNNMSATIRDILENHFFPSSYAQENKDENLTLPRDMMMGKLKVGAEYKIVDIGNRITEDEYATEEDYKEDLAMMLEATWVCKENGNFYNKDKELEVWNLDGTVIKEIV